MRKDPSKLTLFVWWCWDWYDIYYARWEKRRNKIWDRVNAKLVAWQVEQKLDAIDAWWMNWIYNLRKKRPIVHFCFKWTVAAVLLTLIAIVCGYCTYRTLVVLFTAQFYFMRGFVWTCYAIGWAWQTSYRYLWYDCFLPVFDVVWPLVLNKPAALPTPHFMSVYCWDSLFFFSTDACLSVFGAVPCWHLALCPPALVLSWNFLIKAGLWALLFFFLAPAHAKLGPLVALLLLSQYGGVFSVYTACVYLWLKFSTWGVGLFFWFLWQLLLWWDYGWWLAFGLEQASVRPKLHTWLALYLEEIHRETGFFLLKAVWWVFWVGVSIAGGPVSWVLGGACFYYFRGYAFFCYWFSLCFKKKCVVALDPLLDLGVRQARMYVWYELGYRQPTASVAAKVTTVVTTVEPVSGLLIGLGFVLLGYAIVRYLRG